MEMQLFQRYRLLTVLMLIWSNLILAQSPDLDEVVVSAKRPGPELWRVFKEMPDGQTHDMWVLGSVSPLPRRIKWESGIVEEKIRTADAVLMPPSARLDIKVGIFSGLLLLPKALSARKNPDKQTLQQILTADVYKRWLVAKQQYLGRGRSIDRKRPLFAARKLFERALSKSRLQTDELVFNLVSKTAKRHKRPLERPVVKFEITDAKAMVNEISTTSFQDDTCFEQTLQFVEKDLEPAKARAKAWADGDLKALQLLPLTEFRRECRAAVLSSDVMAKRGVSNIEEKISEEWLQSAEKMLLQNKQTFALLPMRSVMDADGLLQQLVARGYQIELPKELRVETLSAEKSDTPSAIVSEVKSK
jgi:hypothetical protein